MNLAAILPWRTSATPTRRETTRRRVAGLRCSLGEVLDLSRRGLRICTARQPTVQRGQTVPVLLGPPTRGTAVSATVMWIRKIKRSGTWQLGLRIHDAGADLQSAVDRFAPPRQPRSTRSRKAAKPSDPATRRQLAPAAAR